MVRPLVIRGLVAGLGSGVAAGVVGFAFGEPLIGDAIRLEAAHGDALVSRDGQRAGLFLATGLYGLAVGGLFGLVFATARGRVSARSDARLAAGLAAALFIAVVLVPFLKYPATPPGMGDPESITERTLLYLTVVASSLLALLAARRTAHTAGRVAGLAVFAATVACVLLVLPAAEAPPPASHPDELVHDFRLVSLAMQAVLWSSLALLFMRPVPWRR
jgi:cytochrome bd-type quinol oxidase subunit 2